MTLPIRVRVAFLTMQCIPVAWYATSPTQTRSCPHADPPLKAIHPYWLKYAPADLGLSREFQSQEILPSNSVFFMDHRLIMVMSSRLLHARRLYKCLERDRY